MDYVFRIFELILIPLTKAYYVSEWTPKNNLQ